MQVAVGRTIAAAPERVWDRLVDWERQPEWMLDALAVEVLTPRRTGVGVVVRCPTRLFGVTVQDVMRVTAWDVPRHLGVVHLGRVVRGTGAFELSDVPEGTRLRWVEEIVPPFGAVGAVGARVVAAPFVRRVFALSLARLATVCEQPDAGAAGDA